ncbi:MAG: hypothetical protein QW648_03010 [Nanoarchaeales archaeon]
MRTLSTPTLLRLVLSIISFAFIITILYYVFKSVGYSGRWNCKLAYAIAAPLGLFMDKNTAIKNAGLVTAVTAAAVLGATIAAYAIGKKYNYPSLMNTARNLLTNKYYQTAITGAITTGISLYALGNVVNSALSHLQKPIVKNMCKASTINIDINKWDDLYLDKCIYDIKKEIKNITKRGWVDQYFGVNARRDKKIKLCLAYQIAKYIIYSFGETIGLNVNMPFAHTHYVILLKSSEQLSLSVADIITIFDLIDVKENKTFYEVFYQKSEANAEPVGEIYNLYKTYCNVKSESFSVNKEKGSIRLIGMYYDLDTDQGKEDYIIYDTVSDNNIYIIIIKYTGLGNIFVISNKLKVS